MKAKDFEVEPLLTPAQASSILGVDPKTVSRYARAGKISFYRTLGGHRRFIEKEVRELAEKRSGKRIPEEGEE